MVTAPLVQETGNAKVLDSAFSDSSGMFAVSGVLVGVDQQNDEAGRTEERPQDGKGSGIPERTGDPVAESSNSHALGNFDGNRPKRVLVKVIGE